MPVAPGQIPLDILAPLGPQLNELDDVWMERVGPEVYYQVAEMVSADAPPEPTALWAFVYVEIHGPDSWTPELQMILDQPMIDERKIFAPLQLAEQGMPVPVDTKAPPQTPVTDLVDSITTGGEETSLRDKLRSAFTGGEEPPSPQLTRAVTPPPSSVAPGKIPSWMYVAGGLAAVYFLMR